MWPSTNPGRTWLPPMSLTVAFFADARLCAYCVSSPIYMMVPSSTNMQWANLAVLQGVCSVVKNLPLTNSVVVGDMIASGEPTMRMKRKDGKRCTGSMQRRSQYMPAARKANSNIQTTFVGLRRRVEGGITSWRARESSSPKRQAAETKALKCKE